MMKGPGDDLTPTFIIEPLFYYIAQFSFYLIIFTANPSNLIAQAKDMEQQPIGVWGQRHRRYLKEHGRASYATLLTSGKLNRATLPTLTVRRRNCFFGW